MTHRTNLTIPEDVTRKARAKAMLDGTSMSAVVTRFLVAWLADEIALPEPEVQSKRKRKDKPIE